MSSPQDGDVVCDPMCGGSSIPIEVCITIRFIQKMFRNLKLNLAQTYAYRECEQQEN